MEPHCRFKDISRMCIMASVQGCNCVSVACANFGRGGLVYVVSVQNAWAAAEPTRLRGLRVARVPLTKISKT